MEMEIELSIYLNVAAQFDSSIYQFKFMMLSLKIKNLPKGMYRNCLFVCFSLTQHCRRVLFHCYYQYQRIKSCTHSSSEPQASKTIYIPH